MMDVSETRQKVNTMGKNRRKQKRALKHREHKRSMQGYYNEYRRGARNRTLKSGNKERYTFDLTLDQFYAIVILPCIYCGSIGSQPINDNTVVCGIDRIDNNKGYIAGNVVSCCADCNIARGNKTKDQFEQWIKRVTLYQTGAKNGTPHCESPGG
jgi:hypothetical protein